MKLATWGGVTVLLVIAFLAGALVSGEIIVRQQRDIDEYQADVLNWESTVREMGEWIDRLLVTQDELALLVVERTNESEARRKEIIQLGHDLETRNGLLKTYERTITELRVEVKVLRRQMSAIGRAFESMFPRWSAVWHELSRRYWALYHP